MATLVWLTYLSLNFVLIPLLFWIRSRRCPFVVPMIDPHLHEPLRHQQ